MAMCRQRASACRRWPPGLPAATVLGVVLVGGVAAVTPDLQQVHRGRHQVGRDGALPPRTPRTPRTRRTRRTRPNLPDNPVSQFIGEPRTAREQRVGGDQGVSTPRDSEHHRSRGRRADSGSASSEGGDRVYAVSPLHPAAVEHPVRDTRVAEPKRFSLSSVRGRLLCTTATSSTNYTSTNPPAVDRRPRRCPVGDSAGLLLRDTVGRRRQPPPLTGSLPRGLRQVRQMHGAPS